MPIDVGTHKWLKLNYDQVGYYRINYSPAMWQSLTDALISNVAVSDSLVPLCNPSLIYSIYNLQSFSVVDRAHLINDVFSLAEATQVKYATALQLTNYLKNEPDYVPWSVAQSKLNGLKNSLYYTELFAKYSKFGQSIVQGPYAQTSWTVGDDQLEK